MNDYEKIIKEKDKEIARLDKLLPIQLHKKLLAETICSHEKLLTDSYKVIDALLQGINHVVIDIRFLNDTLMALRLAIGHRLPKENREHG